jgi:alkylation response protein AidB-like acyl-CoA dehydrogenase
VDFNLSEEETMLRDSLARFVAAEYELPKRRELIASRRDHWHRFVELGWLAVGIPEEAGGGGGDLSAMMLISEVLGGGLALEPYLGCAVLVPQVVLSALGTAASADLLRPMLEGRMRMALANSEYAARGKLCFIGTTARASANGFVLNGTKTAVIGGPSATGFLVAARTAGTIDDPAGITLFRVSREAPGLTVSDYRMIDSSPMSDVTLDHVELPQEAVVGQVGSAFAPLEAATDTAIVAAAFGIVGAMTEALSLTTEHLRTRKQFGGPLRDFQVLRHRAADMLVQLEQARSAAYRGLAGLHEPDPRARTRAASAAKIVVARCSHFVTGQAIQLHGGMGVSEEFRVGHLFKYVAVSNALFGAETYHTERLGSLM